MFIRKLLTITLVTISSMSFASDACNPGIAGKYLNPSYNGRLSYQKAYAEIQELAADIFQMELSIPCGTKLNPSQIELTATSCVSGNFKVIDPGSSQCYLGETGTYLVAGEELRIYPKNRIWTPGFHGVYILKREI